MELAVHGLVLCCLYDGDDSSVRTRSAPDCLTIAVDVAADVDRHRVHRVIVSVVTGRFHARSHLVEGWKEVSATCHPFCLMCRDS